MTLKMFCVHPFRLVIWYCITSFVTAILIFLSHPFWLFSDVYIALTVHLPILVLWVGMIHAQIKRRQYGWIRVAAACFACLGVGLLQVWFVLFIAAGV